MANRTMVILTPTNVKGASDIQKFSTTLTINQIKTLIKLGEAQTQLSVGGGDGQKVQMLQIGMAGQCD